VEWDKTKKWQMCKRKKNNHSAIIGSPNPSKNDLDRSIYGGGFDLDHDGKSFTKSSFSNLNHLGMEDNNLNLDLGRDVEMEDVENLDPPPVERNDDDEYGDIFNGLQDDGDDGGLGNFGDADQLSQGNMDCAPFEEFDGNN